MNTGDLITMVHGNFSRIYLEVVLEEKGFSEDGVRNGDHGVRH